MDKVRQGGRGGDGLMYHICVLKPTPIEGVRKVLFKWAFAKR
ncbi:hypothetical protein HMPREF9073_00870, partial [Capnocytophaga sp. oral taxon 326 str. F0382]